MRENTRNQIKYITGVSIMAALVVLLIFIGTIQIGTFKITLALIPICIGSIIFGKFAGLFLGLLMGFIYLITGEASMFMAVEPFWTIILMLVKSGAAGFLSGLVYQLISKKDKDIGTWIASVVCPLVNTGLFIILTYIFLNSLVTEQAEGSNAFMFIVTGYVGVNFLVEFAISLVLAPMSIYIIKIFKNNF